MICNGSQVFVAGKGWYLFGVVFGFILAMFVWKGSQWFGQSNSFTCGNFGGRLIEMTLDTRRRALCRLNIFRGVRIEVVDVDRVAGGGCRYVVILAVMLLPARCSAF